MLSDLKSYYDTDAARREADEQADWKLALRREFLTRAQAEGKRSLLEIGAGPGKDSRYFMDHGMSVVAVDLSPEMVRLCRLKGVDARVLDFARVAELGRTFDCVWAMNSLLHVPRERLPGVLGALDAVLNKDGLFFIGVWGGEDRAFFSETEGYPAARFFSFLSEEALRETVSAAFDILSFERREFPDHDAHQAVLLRKRG